MNVCLKVNHYFVLVGYHRKNKKYNRFAQPGFGTWAPPDPCANIFMRIGRQTLQLYISTNFPLFSKKFDQSPCVI